jgi:hypothetical protein
MTADPLTNRATLVARVHFLDQADLEGLGACRIAEMRSGAAGLPAARSRAQLCTDREACREAQTEVERLALGALEGREWVSDAVVYARHHFLIGPALEALDDVVLAVLAGHAIDRRSFDALTSAWREAIGVGDGSRELTNRP